MGAGSGGNRWSGRRADRPAGISLARRGWPRRLWAHAPRGPVGGGFVCRRRGVHPGHRGGTAHSGRRPAIRGHRWLPPVPGPSKCLAYSYTGGVWMESGLLPRRSGIDLGATGGSSSTFWPRRRGASPPAGRRQPYESGATVRHEGSHLSGDAQPDRVRARLAADHACRVRARGRGRLVVCRLARNRRQKDRRDGPRPRRFPLRLKYTAGTIPRELILHSIELHGHEVIPRVRRLLAEAPPVPSGRRVGRSSQ
jgi:hypothetical protein